MTAGYIYFMVDESSRDPHFKVGMTTRDPSKRLREYGRSARFLGLYPCSDCYEAERDLLKEMKGRFGVYKGREYFKGDRREALEVFLRVCRASPCPMDIG